jgi:phage pi2 protein 07
MVTSTTTSSRIQTVSKEDTKISILVFGEISEYDILTSETGQNCKLALDAFIAQAKPVNRILNGKITGQTTNCSVTFIAISESRNILRRQKTTREIKEHLVRVYWVPKDCIIELTGRDFKDISNILKEHKMLNKVIVVGGGHSFLGRYRLTTILKSNNLPQPKFVNFH